MKIERKILVNLLERLKPAIATAGSIAELKHIWWDGKFLYAFNNGMGIRIVWETNLQPCGVPGKVFLGLLDSSTAKEVELIQDETSLVLKMGRAKSTMVTLPPDRNPWPYNEVDVKDAIVMKLTKELLDGLRRACIVKASHPTHTYHYGVVLFPNRDSVGLYATDNVVLVEVSVPGKLDKKLSKTVLPHAYISQLLGFKEGEVKFALDAIVTEVGDTQVCSNLLDKSDVVDLPEWVNSRVKGDETPVEVPKDFGEGLERAGVLAGSDPALVTLRISKKEMELTGKLAFGVLQEKFTLAKSGSDGSIVVGLEHLKSLYKEAEEIAIANDMLLLFGKNDALFMIAEHEEPKAKTKVADAE